MRKIYSGKVEIRAFRNNDYACFVGGDKPLASEVNSDMEMYGKFLSVRYFISDKERSIQELEERLFQTVSGLSNADYGDRYSEITGYLWTDEELNVGGHNLLAEIRDHEGQWCVLEVEYNHEGINMEKQMGFIYFQIFIIGGLGAVSFYTLYLMFK